MTLIMDEWKQNRKALIPTLSLPSRFCTPIFPLTSVKKSWCALPLCLIFLGTPASANDKAQSAYERLTAVTAAAALSETRPQARGVLKASEEAVIASGLAGRLTKAKYKPGQSFERGALLAAFDCTQQKAELSALEKAYETLSLRHQNQSHLFKAGAAGELDVSIARSEMEQAYAERDALKAHLKLCQIYAPFSGIVVEKHVAAFETPSLNAPLYTIQQKADLEISIIIPSKWLRWVKRGTEFNFAVDETGDQLKGKIARLGAVVDPVSQTIDVTGKIIGPAGHSLSGMSGLANFKESSIKRGDQ